MKTAKTIATCIALFQLSMSAELSPASLPQTQQLKDGSTVIVESVSVSKTRPAVLRVQFKHVYPNRRPRSYEQRAYLRDSLEGKEIAVRRQTLGAMPNGPNEPVNETTLFWEFSDFPRNSERIYLRMYFRYGDQTKISEQLEFVLPGETELQHRDGCAL